MLVPCNISVNKPTKKTINEHLKYNLSFLKILDSFQPKNMMK